MADALRSSKELGRRAVATSPWLYCAIARSKRGRNRRVVSRRTDLLVEAFPRSGSTFLVAALRVVAPTLSVASHVHHPTHVRHALRHRVPSYVLVRDPVDACTSLAIFRGGVSPVPLLADWMAFYSATASFDRVHHLPFDRLVGEPGSVVSELVAAAGVDLAQPLELDQERVIDQVDRFSIARSGTIDPLRVSHPTAEREHLKADVRRRLDAEVGMVRDARSLYARLVDG